MSIYKEPPPGMFVVPDPQDMTKVKTAFSSHAKGRLKPSSCLFMVDLDQT